ncbi:tyrosine-type recombinase/integrase [Streptosporangium sp. NPDC051022]|uniref:tyrosine-type recombinase/integrase n=1 Tax=Streptosporangium sp. NPDC051022 TaxID=3155752 RepID=UPI003425838C
MVVERLPAVVDHEGAGRLPAVPVPVDPAKDPYRVYLDRLDEKTSRPTMRGCLDRIARLLNEDAVSGAGQPWHLLRYEHTSRIRAMLVEQTRVNPRTGREEPWSAAYVNKHLVALRRVLKEAWRLGLMTAEEHARAVDVEQVEATRVPKGKHVAAEAVGAVFAACDSDIDGDGVVRPVGVRDRALLAALYSTGCRRAELAGLRLADYDPAERSLKVLGKRNKERVVFLTSDAMRDLEAWIAVRGEEPGALFPRIWKGGTAAVDKHGVLAHMTPQAIRHILERRTGEAQVAYRSPHDFRRTFIGELLDAGVDLATAQALVGHASPATTARYDRRPDRTRRAAVDKLVMPQARPVRRAATE